MISIITAAKGRSELTTQCFKNIWNKCSDPNNIEHIIATDIGDTDTDRLMKEYSKYCRKNNYKFKHFGIKFNSDEDYINRNMHRDYWNSIALEASGNIIFGLCNDVMIETENYDIILEDAVKKNILEHNHRYFQIYIDDDWPDQQKFDQVGYYYCSWIILTRECTDIFNGIAPIELSSDNADVYVSHIFSSTDIKAVIDLRDKIKTRQISYQKGNYPIDNIQINKPIRDENRQHFFIFNDILYNKKYYYHKLNNKILQSVFEEQIKCKR